MKRTIIFLSLLIIFISGFMMLGVTSNINDDDCPGIRVFVNGPSPEFRVVATRVGGGWGPVTKETFGGEVCFVTPPGYYYNISAYDDDAQCSGGVTNIYYSTGTVRVTVNIDVCY